MRLNRCLHNGTLHIVLYAHCLYCAGGNSDGGGTPFRDNPAKVRQPFVCIP